MPYVLYAACTLEDSGLEGGSPVGVYATLDEAVAGAREWIARTGDYALVWHEAAPTPSERVYLSTDPGEPHEEDAT